MDFSSVLGEFSALVGDTSFSFRCTVIGIEGSNDLDNWRSIGELAGTVMLAVELKASGSGSAHTQPDAPQRGERSPVRMGMERTGTDEAPAKFNGLHRKGGSPAKHPRPHHAGREKIIVLDRVIPARTVSYRPRRSAMVFSLAVERDKRVASRH